MNPTDTAREMEPCPFCGETERLHEVVLKAGVSFVECGNCDASGPTSAYGYHWNTRAQQSDSTASIVAFLRAEANGARYAQEAAADDHPDKLYRMGQKDGLLLAADAIEHSHHLPPSTLKAK